MADQESKAALETVPAEQEATVTASLPFVGRWNRLVSETNWDKGRIICEWRDALIATGAAPTAYSDEAWSRLVGGVTGQHVGRLRRVYQRFDRDRAGYRGLFWSHFQAALDWDDAEMWLEGAVQNEWSVSQMRFRRWETLGAVESARPSDNDLAAAEVDEDFEPAPRDPAPSSAPRDHGDAPSGPRHEGPDFGDESPDTRTPNPLAHTPEYAEGLPEPTVEFVRPFAELPDLPDDLAEAFDALKLAILHHKLDGWQQIAREDVLATLEALKQLVLAP